MNTAYLWGPFEWYSARLPCRNRFRTAFTALCKGECEINWVVSDTKKDKRLHLVGKKK